jgi:hypothetical protein
MPKLLYELPGSLNSQWIQPIVEQYFEVEPYRSDQHYDRHTLLVQSQPAMTPARQRIQDLGGAIVYDNLWEQPCTWAGGYRMEHANWFWYNESLHYQHLGYDQYRPCRSYDHLALIPVRRIRPHRDWLLESLKPILDQCVWSYLERGRSLPNDTDTSGLNGQRYMNPAWYNSTCFSIVVESTVSAREIFITEKTFKPIAFQHPFVVWAQAGVLKRLHDLGFETFENLFDQTYDCEQNNRLRLAQMIATVNEFKRVEYTKETVQKLQHNHNHFFYSTIAQRVQKEIVEPLTALI